MSILEIDLTKVKENIKTIKSKLNKNQKFCLVAKANAYGLGAKSICRFLNDDVDYFAVSLAEEFKHIKSFVNKPILILSPIYKNITKLARLNAEFCVSNLENFYKIFSSAKINKDIEYKIHIAINTGMNRFGFSDKNIINLLLEKIKKVQNISILGVFSHYYETKNNIFIKNQTNLFFEYKEFFEKNYFKNKIIFHICNSVASLNFNNFDMVRVGLYAYNFYQNSVIKLSSKIINFQYLKKGDSAGYNREFIAKKRTKLAIVAIGYADGLFRNIVKKGYVLIGGKFCKIVAIAMDCIFVDVTNIDCKIFDEVIIIGKSGDNEIFVCDLANWCDTIDYEILTNISSRVKRKYIKG